MTAVDFFLMLMLSLLYSGIFSTRFELSVGNSNIYFHLSLLLVITSCKTRPETLHQPHSSARIQTVTVTRNVWFFSLAHMTVRLWVTVLIGHHYNCVQTLAQLSVHTTVSIQTWHWLLAQEYLFLERSRTSSIVFCLTLSFFHLKCTQPSALLTGFK